MGDTLTKNYCDAGSCIKRRGVREGKCEVDFNYQYKTSTQRNSLFTTLISIL